MWANYTIENYAFEYEVINVLRSGLRSGNHKYHTYIQKTSKLTGNYLGEAVFCKGCDKPNLSLTFEDIKGLEYNTY